MTARVSASLPSGPHMWPDVRIIAGIEASTITSDGTCRLVIPLSESTIASSGPSAMPCSIAFLISAPSGSGLDAGEDPAEPVVRRQARLGQHVAVLGEDVGEEGADHVAEDDRVGHLHHRGLEVDGEQHVVLLGPGDLRGQELAQGRDPHGGAVDDLALGDRHRLLEHRGLAVVAHQLDPQRAFGARRPRTSRWSGSRRPSCARRWSSSRRSTRPSSAGACGRSSSPTPARGGRSCPRGAPG